MTELLTIKQLHEILKVDRVTLYRMLNDGRLKGIKIGNQWRFAQSELDRLLGGNDKAAEKKDKSIRNYPIDCVQKVQEIFAGIIGIGAVTVALDGSPLTEPTSCNPLCELMLSHPSSRLACQSSWHKITSGVKGEMVFQTCHAGLAYLRAKIFFHDQLVGWVISGQYYLAPPDPNEERARFQELAVCHSIPLPHLVEAGREIPVLEADQQHQISEWTPKVADAIQSILYERSELMDRLQRIAELTDVYHSLSDS